MPIDTVFHEITANLNTTMYYPLFYERKGGDHDVKKTLSVTGNRPLQRRLLNPVPGMTLNCPPYR